jgi:hypothetical protein
LSLLPRGGRYPLFPGGCRFNYREEHLKLSKPFELPDRVAIFVAAACGLHCVCFPLFLAIATTSSFIHRFSEPVEKGFLLSAVVLGAVNLSSSWWRKHHRPECLILFSIGILLLLLHDRIEGVIVSAAVSVIGGIFVGSAHFHNLRLVQKCSCCTGESLCGPE